MKSNKYVLPNSVQITPVENFSEDITSKINFDKGDFIVYRPGSRSLPSLIDADTKILLSEFRTPRRIVDSVIRFSQYLDEDPYEVLEKTHPVVCSLIENQLLVEENSPLVREVRALYPVGKSIGMWKVLEIIQVQEDTQVYRVGKECGEEAALKISSMPSRTVIEKLQFEAAILKTLAGSFAPGLLSEGKDEGNYFFIMEWVEGQSILELARTFEKRSQWKGLFRTLLEAYSTIHQKRILQGDLNPRNLLVDSAGHLRIIDFGEAYYAAHPFNNSIRRSPGFEWIIDPETAEAILTGVPEYEYNERSEIYRLCALMYRLYTGKGYLPSELSTVASYKKVLQELPLSFVENGAEEWIDLQDYLLKGLEKLPEDRYSTVGEMYRELQKIPLSASPNHRKKRTLNGSILKNKFRIEDFELDAPTLSLQSGAGGIAFTLMRRSILEEDSDPLFRAIAILEQALDRKEEKSFLALEGLPPMSACSVPHQKPGIIVLQMMLHHLAGLPMDYEKRIEEYLSYGEEREIMEYSFGLSGYLIGLVQIMEILKGKSAINNKLTSSMQDVFLRLETWIEQNDEKTFPTLGFAHGWCGILYTYLVTYHFFKSSVHPAIRQRLNMLDKHSLKMERGVTWPSALNDPYPIVGSGWCSGSAGYVWLWLAAYRALGQKKYFDLADKAALWIAHDPEAERAHLCCGISGRIMALLKMYVVSGDRRWKDYAQNWAQKMEHIPANSSKYRYNLFWGELGKEYVIQELKCPGKAVFPMVDVLRFGV